MRVLYKRTNKIVPDGFIPSIVQEDILNNWSVEARSLFSISQISDRTGMKRQHVQRKVKILRKMGLVERHESS